MKPPKLSSAPTMLAWHKLPGLLYFLKAGSAIKIGVAAASKGKTLRDAVVRRMRQVQSANHELVELLGVICFTENDGDLPMFLAETRERELHIKFASLQRFTRHTVGAEWFTVSDDLLSYIHENAPTPESLELPSVIAFLKSPC